MLTSGQIWAVRLLSLVGLYLCARLIYGRNILDLELHPYPGSVIIGIILFWVVVILWNKAEKKYGVSKDVDTGYSYHKSDSDYRPTWSQAKNILMIIAAIASIIGFIIQFSKL